MPTESNAYDLKVEIRTPADRDFRAGWVPGEDLVVALMTPDAADALGKMMIRSAATSAHPDDEQGWIHGAIDLFTSAARATFLESPSHLVPVAKIALAASSADLDRADQANVMPTEGRVLEETTYACSCGGSHRQIGDALEAPADGQFHAPVPRGRKTK